MSVTAFPSQYPRDLVTKIEVTWLMSPDSLPVSGCTDVHRLYRGLTAGRGSIPVSRTQANVATEKLPGTLACGVTETWRWPWWLVTTEIWPGWLRLSETRTSGLGLEVAGWVLCVVICLSHHYRDCHNIFYYQSDASLFIWKMWII